MARLTLGQKAQRLLAFLMGLGNKRIMRALQPYGFDQAALDEGWALLRRTTASHLDAQRTTQGTREQIARLDAWENRWFPIASAVLKRHYPEVHAKVFLNLSQTQGNQVVVSVGTLVERIEALPAMGQGEALATLIRHGLTNEVLDDARGMLAQLRQAPPVEEPSEDDDPVVDPAAEDAMWSYYLQWSAIARRAISDRRLLRQLGFLRSQRGGSDETLPGDETPDETSDQTSGEPGAAGPAPRAA
jgi:hypothetical protein